MMVETDTGTPKENSQEDMQTLYETSMKSLQEGNVLRGKVINIAGDSVIVDVGLKSEGIVSLQEFPPKEGDAKPVSVDDEVEVMIVGREKESGLLRLSKKRVDESKTWERIDKSLEDGIPLEGHILSEVKGGFIVDMGINAFLPLSQVDIKPVKNPSSFVGRNLKFKVIKSNRRKGSIILSRRVLLEEERDKKRQEFWKNVKDGQIIYGFVRNITDYGAFVDLGGVDGFLHIKRHHLGKDHPSKGIPEDRRRGKGQDHSHRYGKGPCLDRHETAEDRSLAEDRREIPGGNQGQRQGRGNCRVWCLRGIGARS